MKVDQGWRTGEQSSFSWSADREKVHDASETDKGAAESAKVEARAAAYKRKTTGIDLISAYSQIPMGGARPCS